MNAPAKPMAETVRHAGRAAARPLLQGEVPDPADPPPGCAFHGRCPVGMDKCTTAHPPLTEVSPGHFVACYRAWEG